jgi:hypothetical protein
MNLEVWQEILSEEPERGLHPSDGRNMSVELDEAHARMKRINDECAAEAERLSR